MNHYAEHYICKSLWLAAMLDARGVPFVKAVPVDARRCVFDFLNPDNWAYDLANLYYDHPDEATASVPALANSYHKLMSASRQTRERGVGAEVEGQVAA